MADSSGKVMRLTYPTASFSLTVELIAWIEAEAKRRGISKSQIVRGVLLDAKEAQEAKAA